MNSPDTNVLVIGATGYVGGTVLSCLLARPGAATIQITALLRSAEKAVELQAFGISTPVLPKDRIDSLKTLASLAQVILFMDETDDICTTHAILNGMRIRHSTSGDVPTIIHISDPTVLGHPAACPRGSNGVYDDMRPEQIEAINSSNNPYSQVNAALLAADSHGYIKSYSIIPGLIYGTALGSLADARIHETLSPRISRLLLAALDRGRPGMIGNGEAIWPNVHVVDVANLVLKIFELQFSNSCRLGHGYRGYYIAENGEHRWYDLYRAIGDAFAQAGLATSGAEPSPFSDEETGRYLGSFDTYRRMGFDVRCRSTYSRDLGWQPASTAKDMFDGISLHLNTLLEDLLARQRRPPGPM